MESSSAPAPAGQEEVVRLLLRSQSMLSAFLYALVRDWALAEEALQETSVFICSHWQDYTPGTRFGSWARTVARLRLMELLRQKRRTVPWVDGVDVAAPVTDDEWEANAQFTPAHKSALAQCVQSLPAPHRRLVEWRYHEGRDGRFLAEQAGKTIEAVYMTLSRVRRQLRDCVERRLAGAQA
jgi:RNA polymerase sigma-70 factor (ECF subfamily)